MSIYAIGDLHLSGEPPSKPMTIFGEHWRNHWARTKEYWQATVQPEDLVLICGDISWAMTLPEALVDLNAISALPGRKVLLRGNHDYWWSTAKKNIAATQGKFEFLQNNFIAYGTTALCGTRGWNLPTLEGFTEEDAAIYRRELLRLEASLSQAQAAGFQDLVVALHYPPQYFANQPSGFTELCERYQVRTCVFGHVHGDAAQALGVFQGQLGHTYYQLVAADYVAFKVQKI